MAAANPTEYELAMMKLELERFSLSFRQDIKPSERQLVERSQRDKTYFNAGRYSAGARDKVAVAAWHKIGEQDII